MSLREDTSNYSLEILIFFLKNEVILATPLKIALEKYYSLCLSYEQKGREMNSLFWFIRKHKKSKNPIVIFKTIVSRIKHEKKRKEICKIVQDLIELEKTKAFQDIVNDKSNDYVIDFRLKAISDGYTEKKRI